MSLDLNEVLSDWKSPGDEPRARIISGREGEELVQLRIDMGVLQMHLDDRPDGAICHGMSSTFEYIRHELVAGREVAAADWEELAREFQQFNYRRVALSSVADQLLQSGGDVVRTRPHIIRALRDIDFCFQVVSLAEKVGQDMTEAVSQRPGLVFNRARLRTQLRVVDSQFDEAVEEAAHGRQELEMVLVESSPDGDEPDADPGVEYLKQLEKRVRDQYGIAHTLRERLEDAIEKEDFEAAAALRDELRRRGTREKRLSAPPEQNG